MNGSIMLLLYIKLIVSTLKDFWLDLWNYLTTDHDFKVGDKSVAVLVGSDGRNLPVSDITQLTSSKSFIIKGQGEINTKLNLYNRKANFKSKCY